MTRRRTLSIMTIGMLIFASYSSAQTAGLREDDIDEISQDLNSFIPKILAATETPGVSVALIRNDQIVFKRGYGITNTITREPVTVKTVFNAASLGKPVTAFLALQFVNNGLLNADLPLDQYLKVPFLTNEDDRNRINLRHILSHTSGLSNFLGDRERETKFSPGDTFSYSGLGYMYLQDVMFEITGEPLDEIMNRELSGNAGMVSSSFSAVRRDDLIKASGHMKLINVIAPMGIIFVPAMIIAFALAILITYIIRRQLKLNNNVILLCIGLALIVATIFLYTKTGTPELLPFFVGTLILFALLSAVISLLLVFILKKLAWFTETKFLASALLFISIPVIILLLFGGLRIPVPDLSRDEGNAASTFASTAEDIAKFLIEVSKNERGIQDKALSQFEPRVKVSEHISWGYGFGIQEVDGVRAVFHRGQNPSVSCAAVYYPEQKIGVVVLTNAGWSEQLVSEIVSRAIGGYDFWANE